MEQQFESLLEAAREARAQAYAPYSSFAVGAALQTGDGTVFRGCNVENRSFGLTICAERNALAAAVAAGYRDFKALVVVADGREAISPCGACRQFMAEFGDFIVVCANLAGEMEQSSVVELLPRGNSGLLEEGPHLG